VRPADGRDSPLVSIIIPTLDEQAALPALLDDLARLHGRWEIVVADGGSSDATVKIARAHHAAPAVVPRPGGGRAVQLNAGARGASGDVLLFLHADSRLPRDAYASLAEAWRTPAVVGGNFALRFDGGGTFERVLGAVYRRQRRHGFYYGDSSLWVRRERFDELGGFREIAIMDDYDFVRRLERGPGRTRCLPGPASTSARRWRAIGIPRTVLAWFAIRWLYVAGVSPARLVRLYRTVR
jgi:rSAM/selenodomain-associated transferase 2